jgi:hypothetical protein
MMLATDFQICSIPATEVAAKVTKSPCGDWFQPAQAGFVILDATSVAEMDHSRASQHDQ